MGESGRRRRVGGKPDYMKRSGKSDRWMLLPYCTEMLYGPSRKGLRRTQLQRKRRLEKRVYWLLYNRTLSRSKRRIDSRKGLKEAEMKGFTEGDRNTEERYRAELENLLESDW